MKFYKKSLLILLNLFFVLSLFSQEEKNHRTDIYIDISGSMYYVFNDIQKQITEDIIPNIKIGDRLVIFKFYRKMVPIFDKEIRNEKDLDHAKERVNLLLPNGAWTDIDGVLNNIRTISNSTKAKYSFYIFTDGKHELENSKSSYFLNNSHLNTFIKNAKIDKQGKYLLISKQKENNENNILKENLNKTKKLDTEIFEKTNNKIIIFNKILIALYWLVMICNIIFISLVTVFFILTYKDNQKFNKIKEKCENLKLFEKIDEKFKKYFKYSIVGNVVLFIIFITDIIFCNIFVLIISCILSSYLFTYLIKSSNKMRKELQEIYTLIDEVYNKLISSANYFDLTAEYGVEAYKGYDVLMKKENIENISDNRHQLVLGTIMCLTYNEYIFDPFFIDERLYIFNIKNILSSLNLTKEQRKKIIDNINFEYKYNEFKLDKYDYAIALSSGILTGLLDVFAFDKLKHFTDTIADQVVMKFARLTGWSPKSGNENNIASAIGHLERSFPVPYDARYSSDLQGDPEIAMSPSNHHLKSLAHSPDLIGLFFSILDQFTGKVSIISNGTIKRYEPKKTDFQLQGRNTYEKIFYGIVNWVGHIMSDLAGSSGTRGHENGSKGSGIPAPFYSFLQMLNFGAVDVDGEKKTLAELSTKIFEEGADFRHFAAMTIPVAIDELIIKFFWMIKQRYINKKEWKECFPSKKHPELHKMLLLSYSSFCIVDITGAAVKSGSNVLLFLKDINFVNIFKLFKEGIGAIKKLYKSLTKTPEKIEKAIKKNGDMLFGKNRICNII